jgi:hypothetical protein
MDHVRHPERKSRDPDEVTLKISLRDPSVRAGLAFSLGMTAHLFLLAWNFIKAVQYKPDA